MSLEQTAAILDRTPIQEKYIEEVARAVDNKGNRKEVTELAVAENK